MPRATSRFWSCFEQSYQSTQSIARRNYERLRDDPRHPSLRFKKVGDFWSVRVGRSHRAITVEDEGDLIWMWIGTHGEYDRIVG